MMKFDCWVLPSPPREDFRKKETHFSEGREKRRLCDQSEPFLSHHFIIVFIIYVCVVFFFFFLIFFHFFFFFSMTNIPEDKEVPGLCNVLRSNLFMFVSFSFFLSILLPFPKTKTRKKKTIDQFTTIFFFDFEILQMLCWV